MVIRSACKTEGISVPAVIKVGNDGSLPSKVCFSETEDYSCFYMNLFFLAWSEASIKHGIALASKLKLAGGLPELRLG